MITARQTFGYFVRALVVALILRGVIEWTVDPLTAWIVATTACLAIVLDGALRGLGHLAYEWLDEYQHWERQRSETFRPENEEAR